MVTEFDKKIMNHGAIVSGAIGKVSNPQLKKANSTNSLFDNKMNSSLSRLDVSEAIQ